MELKWAKTDLHAAARLRDTYRDQYYAEQKITRRQKRRINSLETATWAPQPEVRDSVKAGNTTRFFVQAYDEEGVIDEFDAKDLQLINHWIRDQKIQNEDLTFTITRSVSVEVNSGGQSQADLDYQRTRSPYGYNYGRATSILGY
jgi:hypothetical protein